MSTPPRLPTVSIVINTLNRGALLEQVIKSFNWLKYEGEFEVIVVNGPSTDNSADVIKSFGNRIKAGTCDVANLSVSRNIGICMADGDIVAFIDDDAVPEPEWLTQLAAPYLDPSVAGSGGLVFNHTGYDFQYRYCLMDRLGNPDLSPPGASPQFNFPSSEWFPHLLGCNSSFRRSALLEIGGFDEEYEYFLDESDVCLRIIDEGYQIAQIDGAYVHHKYAPSNLRGENRIPKYRYPVVKNKIYFTLKHSLDFHSFEDVLEEHKSFITRQRNEVIWAVENKLLDEADGEALETDIERAQLVGMRRGLEGVLPNSNINDDKLSKYHSKFKLFVSDFKQEDPKALILISKDYPPEINGGIGLFKYSLATSLAMQGHLVHVITKSPDTNRVDFEEGVWVHRMVEQDIALSERARAEQVPQHIWNWSATALREAERISTHREIDSVITPIWDCEGVAFAYSDAFPMIVSLQTTLSNFLDTNTDLAANPDWMASFGTPMLALEKTVIQSAEAVWSISKAIQVEVNARYEDAASDDKTFVIPIGLKDVPLSRKRKSVSRMTPSSLESKSKTKSGIEILYVGRLETRKGIDVLLKILPKILTEHPNAKMRIIGNDTLNIPGKNQTYRDGFEKKHSKAKWLDRVEFCGRVDDATLLAAYSQCDIFVAPSRFESFGQIFLEAMRFGKPVIGCKAGGMPEIIKDGETGFVAKPNSPIALQRALETLLSDPALAKKMGKAGRADFLARFSPEEMATLGVEAINFAKKRFDRLDEA